MSQALAAHDALARSAVESHHGTVVKMTGDGMHAAFDDALDALAATVDLQQALADPAATCGVPLRVRCGLHAGVVERRDNDYFGSPVNRAARIMSAAHGGQVLLSQAVVDRVREILPAAVSLRDLGKVRLKDLSTPEHVYQVVHPQLRQDFPALRSLEATPNNLPQQVTSFIGREKELAELQRLLAKTRAADAHRLGRLRQDPPGLQVAADSLEQLPGRRLAGGARAARGPGSRATDGGDGAGPEGRAGQADRPDADRAPQGQAAAAAARQLRAPARRLRAAGRRAPASMPAGDDSREQPGSARHRWRAGVPRAVAVAARSEAGAHAGVRRALRGGATVHRPCAARPPGLSRSPTRTLPRSLPSAIGWTGFRWPSSWRRRGCARFRSRRSIGKLDQRFRLLTGGSRTALPRQQTLRSLIDWSYDLLNDAGEAAVAAAVGLRRRLDAGGGGAGLRRRRRGGRRKSSIC